MLHHATRHVAPAVRRPPGAAGLSGSSSVARSWRCRAHAAWALSPSPRHPLRCPMVRRVGGLLIDAALGEGRQLLVGGLFLVERLLQQIRGLVVAHRARPGHQRAVCGHLVVLGTLAGGNQARVHRRLVEVLLHDRLAFLDDAGNAVAVLAAHLLLEALEHLFQALDVSARLLEVRLERRAQLGRCSPPSPASAAPSSAAFRRRRCRAVHP